MLIVGTFLDDWIGRDAAVLIVFGVAAALLLARRPAGPREAIPIPSFVVGLATGFASFPAWMVMIATAGLWLGFVPRPQAPPEAGSAALWIAMLILAPVFEELLYRERLIPTLRARVGAVPAIVFSSILFALPHVEPWAMLGTFLVGLALGAVYLVSGSVLACIGLHAGLNLAVLVCGSPPLRFSLDPLVSLLMGGLLLAICLRLAELRGAAGRFSPSRARRHA